MFISGAVIGFATLVLTLGGTLILPFCTPCAALPLGVVGGFLTSFIEKPKEKSRLFTRAALSGALAGTGAILGQSIGAVINGLAVGPERAAAIMEEALGFSDSVFDSYNWGAQYWVGLIASTACISLFNVFLMAFMGGVGGVLWRALADEK